MADPTPVDRLYEEAKGVIEALKKASEPSLEIAAGDNFRKALLLAAASYFEKRLCDCVLAFVQERAPGSKLVASFVRNKAIARQYHTWFQWDQSNANAFFGLFGNDFRAAMIERVGASEELRAGVEAFMAVGSERNKLVHQDYASFALEKTMDEIYAMYGKAMFFIDALPTALRELDGNA